MNFSLLQFGQFFVKQKQKRPHRDTTVRVIGGQWRSRKLPICQVPGLRPTGDRIRETLFNWLMRDIQGLRCLDLFAGTGALGIEALSRGASFVHFVETNTRAAQQLQDNLDNLSDDNTRFQIDGDDALSWLDQYSGSAFDLVFLDPPFASNLWQDCIQQLIAHKVLAARGLIYVESPIETKISLPKRWRTVKSLRAGSVNAQLFQQQHEKE